MDIRVVGAEDFAIVARRLKQAGDKGLQRELYAGLNRSVKPLIRDVKDSVGDYLPEGGGYAGEVQAQLSVKVRRRAGGRNPAVYLIGKAGSRDLGRLNRGVLRKPLFGNKQFWFSQRIPAKFWDEPLEQGAPRVRLELVQAIAKVARQIEAGF